MSALYLHIGLPKTGTTALQARFSANRAALKDAGLLYPFVRPDGMFQAAVEVLGWADHWGFQPEEIEGTWAEFVRRAAAYDGRTLVSHEIFGRCMPRHIRPAMEQLEQVEGVELHIVATARDLARQVTAVWQERVKNGHDYTFDRFVEREGVLDIGPRMRDRAFFWREQGLPHVLGHWAKFVPDDRIHVVTCPPAGGDPEELFRRFEGVFGLGPELFTKKPVADNSSLGAAEVELLRRINAALGPDMDRGAYASVVKRFFAQNALSEHRTARAVTPGRLREPLQKVTDQWVRTIEERGWHVHGDLADLTPLDFDDSGAEPGDVPEDRVLAATPELIARLLEEIVSIRGAGEVFSPGQQRGAAALRAALRRIPALRERLGRAR
ncbi:hypothetical protein [Nocardioides pacificus]